MTERKFVIIKDYTNGRYYLYFDADSGCVLWTSQRHDAYLWTSEEAAHDIANNGSGREVRSVTITWEN